MLVALFCLTTFAARGWSAPVYGPITAFTQPPFHPNGELTVGDGGLLWGTSLFHGTVPSDDNSGTIFTLDPATGKVSVVVQLPLANGASVSARDGLLDDGAGFMWGTTVNGGRFGYGTIFKINQATGQLITEAVFENQTAGVPVGSPLGRLVRDSHGNFWGTTYYFSGYFKYDPVAHRLESFRIGDVPNGGLVDDGAGSLWGTTYALDNVTTSLFKINIETAEYSHVFDFNQAATTGLKPSGSLAFDGQGHLLGTTLAGGAYGRGVVFRYDITNNQVSVLGSFPADSPITTNASPLTSDGAGGYWGMTSDGGSPGDGTIFKVDAGGTLSTLLTFDNSTLPGRSPRGGLVYDGAGHFYATTFSGGVLDRGTVLSIDATTLAVNSVSMTHQVPGGVYNTMTPDGTGQLWVAAPYGAGSEFGALATVNEHTGEIVGRVSFTGTAGAVKGSAPSALLRDSAGVFWGVTNKGGAGDLGTVYKYDPSAAVFVFTTLVEFTGTSGSAPGSLPRARLTDDGAGNLWGTTTKGGAGNFGTVFRITKASGAFTPVFSFTGAAGAFPGSLPAQFENDGLGDLWSTTAEGGAHDFGTVFRIKIANSTLTYTHELVAKNIPNLGLALDGRGFLWGTTPLGGASGRGTVFKINVHSGAMTTVHSITTTEPYAPRAGLVNDGAGFMWGTADFAPLQAPGAIIKIGITSGVYTAPFTFTADTGTVPGSSPLAGLVRESDGNLYGVTSAGGVTRQGMVAGGGQVFGIGTGFQLPPIPAPTKIAGDGAVVTASINPDGVETFVSVRYGETVELNQETSPVNVGSGLSAVPVAIPLTGLKAGAIYRVQLVVRTADGIVVSPLTTFYTLAGVIEFVAASGDSIGGGRTLKTAGPPAIDSAGRVVFRATLAGTGLTAATNTSLLLCAGGAPLEIAQTRDGTNLAGGVFTKLSDPVLGSGGAVGFIGDLKVNSQLGGQPVTALNNEGVFIVENGVASVPYRKGGAVPMPGGATFKQFLTMGLNHAGDPAFIASLNLVKASPGLFASDQGGALHWLAPKGGQFAGAAVTGTTAFAQLPTVNAQARSLEMESGNLAAVILSASAHQAIGLAVNGAADFTRSLVLQSHGPGAVHDLAYTEPAVDALGDTAFLVTSAGVPAAVNKRLVATGPSLSTSIPSGTPVSFPAVNPASYFRSFNNPILAKGAVAFLANAGSSATATASVGLWRRTAGANMLLTRIDWVGRPANSIPGAVLKTFTQIALTDAGVALYSATLSGVPRGHEQTVLAYNARNISCAVVAAGMTLDVHGTSKMIKSIGIFESALGAMGQNRSLDPASGYVVFRATFSDNSWGIYKVAVAP